MAKITTFISSTNALQSTDKIFNALIWAQHFPIEDATILINRFETAATVNGVAVDPQELTPISYQAARRFARQYSRGAAFRKTIGKQLRVHIKPGWSLWKGVRRK